MSGRSSRVLSPETCPSNNQANSSLSSTSRQQKLWGSLFRARYSRPPPNGSSRLECLLSTLVIYRDRESGRHLRRVLRIARRARHPRRSALAGARGGTEVRWQSGVRFADPVRIVTTCALRRHRSVVKSGHLGRGKATSLDILPGRRRKRRVQRLSQAPLVVREERF